LHSKQSLIFASGYCQIAFNLTVVLCMSVHRIQFQLRDEYVVCMILIWFMCCRTLKTLL